MPLKSPAFRFYAADFMMGTLQFTAEQRGAYITLLCVQWDQGSVPDDIEVCAKIAGVTPETLAPVWLKFGLATAQPRLSHGSATPARRQNARLELERSLQTAFRERQSENARNGAKTRHGRATAQPRQSDGTATAGPRQGDGTATAWPRQGDGTAVAVPEGSLSFSSSLSGTVPPIVPQGGQEERDVGSADDGKKKKGAGAGKRAEVHRKIELAVQWGDLIGALFGRPAGRASSAMLVQLEDHAQRGLLPPDPVKWAALKRMHEAATADPQTEDFELRCKWLKSAEALAAALPEACDRAEAWVNANFGKRALAQKKEPAAAPDPDGWREWFAKVYPTAEVPARFDALPPDIRDDFNRREKQ